MGVFMKARPSNEKARDGHHIACFCIYVAFPIFPHLCMSMCQSVTVNVKAVSHLRENLERIRTCSELSPKCGTACTLCNFVSSVISLCHIGVTLTRMSISEAKLSLETRIVAARRGYFEKLHLLVNIVKILMSCFNSEYCPSVNLNIHKQKILCLHSTVNKRLKASAVTLHADNSHGLKGTTEIFYLRAPVQTN